MAAIEIQKKLFSYGNAKGYFTSEKLNLIEKSCCSDCLHEVIDFDKTKELVVENNKWTTLKSCDALVIHLEKEGIDFIEMKSSTKILSNKKIDSKEKLQQQIEKFDFANKIHDSLTILNSICNEKNCTLDGAERKSVREITKNYIVVTDLSIKSNPLEFLSLSLEHLAHYSSSITTLLKDVIDNLKGDTLNSLKPPVLMDCETLEKYLAS
jgi:hypothetical protein